MNKFRKAISATLIASIMTPSLAVAQSVIPMPENTTIVQALESQSVTSNVEDGIYTAPVEVAHAYNPGQKSMANGAIEHRAKVVYRGDKVTIELTFKGMNLMGMKGHLTNLFFYRDNKDPLNNNDVIEAEVIKSHIDLGLDGNEHNYPQIFRYTMDKSVFEASDFLWIKVWVDAMDAIGSGPGNPITPGAGEQNAKVVIDKTKFTKVILNTQDLSNEIAAAKAIEQGKKTEEAFNTLKVAIASAEKVLEEATEQTQLDEAVKTLKAAVKAFNESADKVVPTPLEKEALTKEIAEAKKVEQGKKTDEAFNALKAAITSAEEVLNSASEQTAIDGAVTTLNKAIEAFKSSPDKEAQLNKTDLDAKIKDADKISQGKKSEDAFKTLKAAIEAAKSVLNSANTQEQINEALTNLNKAIEAFSNSADVNVTPGASEKVYTLPVKLMHSVQDKESMGNKALVSPAKVSIKGDDVNIDLTFQGIEVPLGATKFYGHLTNLFSFEDNTIKGEAIPAEVLEQMEDKAMDGSQKQFPKVFRIKLTKAEFDNLKDNTLYVKVWVDAMDGLMGGTPGAGAQNARLVFDKSKMTKVTPGGETPTPTPTPTPNVPSREDVVDALKRYANLGGPQYTYQSNMMYVNAYNSLMSLLTKPNATDMQVKFAIDNLKAAAAGLTLDTSKPNNSGNNQGWGNNNQGWGNNNQGWGNNNQGWGNNNSGWGNNNQGWGNNNQGWGNNNQGWGNNNKNNQNNGPVTVQYEVPVEVLHAHQSGYSMANAAINHTARVEERDGKFRYSVNFHAIQRDFGGKTLTGNLTNLFIIDGSKYRADQSGNTWSWTMNGKYDRVNVAVWVDAMDEIAGKGPGGGEQNAILSFNWNNAREVGRVGGNNNNQNQQNQNQQNQQKQQNQNQQAVQSNNKNNFTDTSGHWAKTAIDYVVSKGYFAGLSNTEFGPNKSITRGQFVSVLGRMLNVNVNDYKDQNFKDVKSGMYYSPYITWANKVGIVSGVGQGNFAPDKELTREEMAVMMTKFLKVSGKNLNAKGNTNAFKDEDKIQGWAKDSVKEMARLGVVSGMGDGSFAPKSQFTRAQVAQVLYNIDHN
ncbi:hypothetical protein ABID14_001349 [Peptoniphilus olsenii]|uniref:SLH domain-containing protein n=1 Tax=Peptoniphilus olsenii TaxID=411570 RepID=A0ABV2JAA1_9FIRM